MSEQGAFINSVKISDDFDLEKLRISGQCFRIKLLPDGAYRFIKGGHVLDMKMSGKGTYDVSCRDEEFADIWHDVGDGRELYLKIKSYEDRYPSVKFTYWIEDTIKCYLEPKLWPEQPR